VAPAAFDQLVDDLSAGRLSEEFPPHGTLGRVRQRTTAGWSGAATAQQATVDAL
jgi:NADH-quinone oxidoreductase subunit E